MDEFAFIDGVRHRVGADPAGVLGIGDDCCVWTPGGPTCLSTDAIVEGRHFLTTAAPDLVGRKAAAAALSDLAAMGAVPRGAVVAIQLPTSWDGVAIMDGLVAELQRHDCPLLGGDTTGAERLALTVTVWGEAAPGGRLLRRDGGRVGDLLVVTGALGGSLASGRHLRPEPRLAEGQWLAQRPFVHALMDLSDGLAGDARRLARASGCGEVLLPGNVPVHGDVDPRSDSVHAACCDGEDFELLLAVEPGDWPTLLLAWPFATPLTQVGWLIEQPYSLIEDTRGRLVPSPYGGFAHRL
jgi:thiamine-monophosphate kinase